ncbi:MAG: DUF134 domain-containing protein [Thermosphaera sp.]
MPRGGPWRCRRKITSCSTRGEEFMYIPVKAVIGVEPSSVIEIYDYELEALKLVHLDGLSTDEAALRMGVSKATFWRILESCRWKLAKAFSEKRPLKLVSETIENDPGPGG